MAFFYYDGIQNRSMKKEFRIKSDVNSQHQNRTGFYGHKSLDVKDSKRKGFFLHQADSEIYFGVLQTTHRD